MKTIKIKIAMEMKPEGFWNAYGYGGDGWSATGIAREHVTHCITAELQVPEVHEIPGTVEEVKP